MPAPTPEEHLRGFAAAAHIVERALDKAEINRPKDYTRELVKSAGFHEGYWQGLLVAHCLYALGESPTAGDNPAQIAEALAERDSERA